MSKVISLLLLGFIAWYWSYSQKLKQLALGVSIKRCNEAGVQFLDHSVVLHRIGFRKNTSNKWKMIREYRFEFTSTGEHRYIGRIILQGHHLVSTELEPYNLN
ncbi:MAG: DUF3301 domain-containing protein [Enterobacterales bacterium]|nr:DUF3301 domain-containing protein [Enterobacterales bacterium]